MKLIGMVLAALLIGLLVHGAWLGLGVDRSTLPGRLQSDMTGVISTVPEGPGRAALERTTVSPSTLTGLAGAAIRLRATVAARVLPVLGALLLVGLTAGMLLRERLAGARGYASVTGAFLAKGVLALGLAAYGFTALAPCGAPIGILYIGSLGASIGTAVYVANLPPRL